MSRKYQGLIALNTKSLEGGTLDALVTSVSKDFEAEGAKVEQIEQLGRKQFAYNSRHLEAAHYVNYTFQGDADTVAKIQTRLKLNGHVHIQHYQRIA
jgi:small subunit ribosomal protein S6